MLKAPSALKKLLGFALGVVVAIPAIYYVSNYDLIQRVPRIRVGPLHQELPAKDHLRIIAIGDTGSGDENQYAVAAAMERRCQAEGLDAILMLGDNAYQVGMESVDDPQWQTKVEIPYGSTCLKKVPIFAVLGNHDYRANPSSQIEYTSISSQWNMPNRFYSVDFGYLLKVVAIDSNLSDFCFQPEFCSLDYMRHALDQPTTIWRFVIAHHPIAAASAKGHGHSGGMRETFLLPMVCNKADIWLAGHAHMLEHRTFDGCKMQHFVSGGGGGALNELDLSDVDYAFGAAKHGFLELFITRRQIETKFFDTDLSVLYETTIDAM